MYFSIKILWHEIYTKSTVLGLFKCSTLRGMPVHKLSYAKTMGIAQCKVHVFLKVSVMQVFAIGSLEVVPASYSW